MTWQVVSASEHEKVCKERDSLGRRVERLEEFRRKVSTGAYSYAETKRMAAALNEGGLSEPDGDSTREGGGGSFPAPSGSESDADVQGGRGTHGAEDTASKPGSNPVPPRHSLAADQGSEE